MATIGSSTSSPAPAVGNTEMEMVESLGKYLKIDKANADAQPDYMIAVAEEAYAQATANMSFEERAAYWENLAKTMKNAPNQLKAFFEGQDNLFNNNPALQKLQKELLDIQAKCQNDQNSVNTASFVTELGRACLALGIVGALFGCGYSSQLGADESEMNQDIGAIASTKGGIESTSQALSGKMNSGAENIINNSSEISDAIIGDLKTAATVAQEVAQHNGAA